MAAEKSAARRGRSDTITPAKKRQNPSKDPLSSIPPSTESSLSRSSSEQHLPAPSPQFTSQDLPPATTREEPPKPVVTRRMSSILNDLAWDGGPDDDMKPGDFLRTLKRSFMINKISDDKERIDIFECCLQYEGTADKWFRDLPKVSKADWDALVAAFEVRWALKDGKQETRAERVENLMEWKLKEEELGKKVQEGGSKGLWTHVRWAEGLKSRAACDKEGIVFKQVKAALPEAIRILITSSAPKTYDTLAEAVKNLEIEDIQDAIKRTRPRTPPQTPSKDLARALAASHLQSPSPPQPLYHPSVMYPPPQQPHMPFQTGSRGGYAAFSGYNRGRGRGTSRPTSTLRSRDIGVRYADLQRHQAPPFPDTEEGMRQYNEAVTAWLAQNSVVDEQHPFPLRPGGAPVGSMECYSCGRAGHSGRDNVCTTPPVRAEETEWRRIAGWIISNYRRSLAAPPGPTQVNYVNAAMP